MPFIKRRTSVGSTDGEEYLPSPSPSRSDEGYNIDTSIHVSLQSVENTICHFKCSSKRIYNIQVTSHKEELLLVILYK